MSDSGGQMSHCQHERELDAAQAEVTRLTAEVQRLTAELASLRIAYAEEDTFHTITERKLKAAQQDAARLREALEKVIEQLDEPWDQNTWVVKAKLIARAAMTAPADPTRQEDSDERDEHAAW